MIIKDGWMYPESAEELKREFVTCQYGDQIKLFDGAEYRDNDGTGHYGGGCFIDTSLPYRRRVSESTSPVMNHFI